MIFGQKVYQQLIADLKQANSDLDGIKAQIIELSASNTLAKQFRRPLAKLRKLRENAKHLLSAVNDNWKCDCVKQHTLFLCPRQPVDDADFEFELASTHLSPAYQVRSIELSLDSPSKDAHTGTNGISTQMQGLHLSPTKSSQLTLVNTISNVSVKSASKAKVTFKDANATSVSISTIVDDSDEINDLRQLFCTAPKCKSGDLAGYIKPRSSPIFRHDLFSVTKDASFDKAIPVGAACCNSVDCAQRKGIMCDLDNTDRLSLAASLARNTFLLQGTWLEPTWSTNKFMIPCQSTDHLVVEELHLAHDFNTSSLPTNASKDPERLLEPLGMALVEVLLGRHITKPSIHDQPDPPQQCTNIQSAPIYDAIQKLYKTYGRQPNSIGNAVRECISWSGPVSKKGFDDPDFSSAAYEKVIWPLIENARIFEGK